MPRGDRTGPAGMGPMTGRGAGYCAGFGAPGFMSAVPGRGFGRGAGWGRGFWGSGFGGGRGWRHRFYATGRPGWWGAFGAYDAPYYGPEGASRAPAPEMEKQALKGQAEVLQSELDSIRKRLDELETGASED